MRPTRWSKKTDELVHYVAGRCRPSYQSELGHWLDESARFQAFLAANKDKVRKKLTVSDDEDHRMDVRAELRTAYLLLADRRFEVAFEAYGMGRVGPDLTVTYRANQRFNIEVTRLRASGEPGEARLANVIAGKLRQLQTDLPNALLIAGHELGVTEDGVAGAVRLLKRRMEADARLVPERVLYLRLGAVLVVDEVSPMVFVANRDAKMPMPRDIVAALTTCLGGDGS